MGLKAGTFKCFNCGKEKKCSSSSKNKFCSNECFQEHKWETTRLPLFESGGLLDSKSVKRALIKLRGYICELCGNIGEHNGLPLTLQLDHIDGNSDNNLPENVRLLCPNCHSQTPTFGSKGKGNRYKKTTKRNTYLQDYKAS